MSDSYTVDLKEYESRLICPDINDYCLQRHCVVWNGVVCGKYQHVDTKILEIKRYVDRLVKK